LSAFFNRGLHHRMNSRGTIHFRKRLNVLCRLGDNRSHAPAPCILHGSIHLLEFRNAAARQNPPDKQNHKPENDRTRRQAVCKPSFHASILRPAPSSPPKNTPVATNSLLLDTR